jgi:hypothetical protein
VLEEIMHIRELNNSIHAEMVSKLKNSKESNSKDSRVITFQPQDRTKHQALLSSQEELQVLKEKYAKLLQQANEPVFQLSQE